MIAVSETTVASVLTFILCMLLHPEIQRQAQQEVDSVVGPDRLPELSDIAQLPYLLAVWREVLRLVELFAFPTSIF
jgi:cytochrome P450